MSPYTQTLAQLRLGALEALQDALNATTDPAELRRIAQAIFRAPPPDDDIDSALPIDEEQDPPDDPQASLEENQHEAHDHQHDEDGHAERHRPSISPITTTADASRPAAPIDPTEPDIIPPLLAHHTRSPNPPPSQ